MSDTHVVTNQVPPLVDHNPATSPVLIEALIREGGQWGLDEVTELGALSGSAQAQRWGDLADRNQPILHTHDRYGHRVDEIEYDPAYHELMRAAIAHGLHGAPWADDRPGAHVVRAAKMSVWTPEPGHVCPISMTYAVVPALRHNAELAEVYEPLLTSREYDPELKVPATKAGITAGMSMTEKQGGSDVRAGTTQAVPNGDGSYTLTGHKWFTSAAMSDIFLVLAQAPGGLSCFMLPRVLPDGTRNRMFIQRLKDKLGNHGNASSEIEYDGAIAWLVGEEGRGVPTIIEMVNLTRLDCTLGSATSHAQRADPRHPPRPAPKGVRRVPDRPAADAQRAGRPGRRGRGRHHHRHADGRRHRRRRPRRRARNPASPNRIGRRQVLGVQAGHPARGRGHGMPGRQRLRRGVRHAAAVPRGAADGHLGRLRQRQRTGYLARHGNPAGVCRPCCSTSSPPPPGRTPGSTSTSRRCGRNWQNTDAIEYRARKVAEDISLALQGSLLVRHGHPAVAEAFLATRMGGNWGGAFGTLPTGLDLAPILERCMVKG